MELIKSFERYLFSQKQSASKATVKNYISDISRFVKWYESAFKQPFNPVKINQAVIESYKTLSLYQQDAYLKPGIQTLSAKSVERHISSLKKFFTFLYETQAISSNPFTQVLPKTQQELSLVNTLLPFKNYLYENKISDLSIKNYLIDIQQFLTWLETVKYQRGIDLLASISQKDIEEFKNRLINQAGFSPISINRKLSALRKYFLFLREKEFIESETIIDISRISNISTDLINTNNSTFGLLNQYNQIADARKDSITDNTTGYSSFPPLRLMQSIERYINMLFDILVIAPLANIVQLFSLQWWKIRGKKIFSNLSDESDNVSISPTSLDTLILGAINEGKETVSLPKTVEVENIKKSFYAPLEVSTAGLPLFKKIWLILRHKRPAWYIRYHSHKIAHYLNFGILILFVMGLGYVLFGGLSNNNPTVSSVAPNSQPKRFLAFGGKLSNISESIKTTTVPLRFSIYSDPLASGSALLWQEVKLVKTNPDGSFSTKLGSDISLPDSLFTSNHSLYLGVTVKSGEEMRPRQQLITTSLSANSARLQGMLPITTNGAGNKNVLLALDSAGNLAIGGGAGTVFQATEGVFTLSGLTTFITTNPGTNGDIQLSPDGNGLIDIQKPIFNSTTNNNRLAGAEGAVEVDDIFAVLASSSGQAAVNINQNGNGNLISASASGIAKFILDNEGNGFFNGVVALNGSSLITNSTSFSFADTNTINLSIGGSATSIRIGANSGNTTVNNNLFVNGDSTFGNTSTDSIKFIGNVVGDIIPATGSANLGSATNPWTNLYVSNIIGPSTGASGYWQRNSGTITPITLSDSLNLGDTNTNNAIVHLAASTNSNSFIRSGNFGLGMTTPESKFTVSGSSGGNSLAVFNETGGNNILTASASGTTRLILDNGGSLNIIGGGYKIGGNIVLTGSQLGTSVTSSSLTSVGSLNSGSIANGFGNITTNAIIAGSQMGIGTTSPESLLHVTGTATGKALVSINEIGDQNIFTASKSGNTQFVISNSGNVGIGQSNPANDKLEVFGDARVGNALTNGCLKSFDGTALVGSCSSDLRLKKNINSIENVLSKLNLLRPVTYNMRADEFPEYGFRPSTAYGLIAQEVEQIFPQLVSTDEPGYKTVKYGTELSMLTLAGLNELTTQVNYLTNTQGTSIIESGDLLIEKQNNEYFIKNNNGSILKSIVGFGHLLSAKISTGLIQAKEASFDNLAITTHNVTIAGSSLREYILSVVSDSITSQKVSSPLSLYNGKINFISPLASDSQIGLRLTDSQFSILNSQSATGSAVASFDNQGNATLSGTLQANGLQSQDASVSGTLRAGNIIADSIDGLDAKLATLAANMEKTQTDLLKSTDSSIQQTTSSAIPTFNSQLSTHFISLGSASASLAYVPNFKTDFANVNQALTVLGPTSMADLSVAGQLSINGSLILAENSINTLGSALEIQPLRQGIISFMSGLVTIDTEGNMDIKGSAKFAKDVTIKGKLAANIIAPVPGSDLIIQLPTDPNIQDPDVINNASLASQSQTNKSAVIVKNANGNGILTINGFGDVIASGAGAFRDIAVNSLNIVRGAQADTSAIETVASGSAGVATITAGYTSRTIYSPYVTKNSLIYITPKSETTSNVPYLSRQTAEDPSANFGEGTKGSFTIEIPTASANNVEFNWWIVN